MTTRNAHAGPVRGTGPLSCLGRVCAGVSLAALMGMPALAEDWQTNFTAYLFVPWSDLALETAGGASIETSADPSDLIQALEFGAMFAGESRKDNISLLYDIFYSGLGQSGTLSGPLGASVDVDVDMLLASFAVGYDLQRSDAGFAQVFGGLRYTSLQNTVAATGGGPIGGVADVEQDFDYFEPLVGFRARTRIGERTSLGGFLNVGGFGAGSELTVDSYIGVDYAISESRSANFGLRYLSIDYEGDSANLDMDMYGPVLGMSWRF